MESLIYDPQPIRGEDMKLGMMYHIFVLCPRTDIDMGRCSFGIKLYPAWREAVKTHGMTQEMISTAIKNYHRQWLDGCGFGAIFDPDNSGFDRDKSKPPGPNSRPLYDVHCIRIAWGEWGPEHITVPGNACGLDISRSINSPEDGVTLEPHNIDSIGQQILLLTIFTTIADHIIGELEFKTRYPLTL